MITRFAPSPTGPLHLGHAYSAILGFDMAMAEGGDWLLRIEDIDQQRSKPEWDKQSKDDLLWLGLWWPKPVMRQSARAKTYARALMKLWKNRYLYHCECSRADILSATAAPQEGTLPLIGSDGLVYPGTCKNKGLGILQTPLPGDAAILERDVTSLADRKDYHGAFVRAVFPQLLPNLSQTLRLHMDRVPKSHGLHRAGEGQILSFQETGKGPDGATGLIEFSLEDMIHNVGDVVLARSGMGTSYHLSVVLDDAAQGVTHVVRGEDLFEATKIHVVLQKLLGLPTPTYHHHRLIRDENGKRLAKRDDARAISLYRKEGAKPADIRRMVGLPI